MTTRKAIKSDLKDLSKLFDDYRIFYEKQSDLQSAEHFLHERLQNKDSEIFVAENAENKLVGFVQLYPIFSSTRMQKLWLLNDLFVDNRYRGKGISVELINESKKLCQETNACGLVLETAKANDIGNGLYPRTGFSLVCPNCGGGFEKRPTRPKKGLEKYPMRNDKVINPVSDNKYLEANKNIDPRKR